MRLLIVFLFSLSCFAYSQDRLIFNQGEQWDGTISSVNDKIIQLKNSLAKDDLKFKLDNLKAIEFGETKPLGGTHRVTLINGDGLSGDLEELNKEFLVLKTLCSGILQIPRKFVSVIEPQENSELIEGGISANDGWKGTISNDGSFQGSISREIDCKQPFILSAEIDLADAYSCYLMFNNVRTNTATQRFYFYTNIGASRGIVIINGQRQVNNGELRISSNVTNHSERASLGNASLEEGTQVINLKIFINPQESFVAVNANNNEVGKAKLSSKFDFDQLLLSLRSNGGKPFLKQFKIEKWNGKYTSYLMAEKDDKHDNILLKNGDIAYGQVSNIKENKLLFSSKLGDHKLDMELISSIILLNAKSEPVKKDHLLRLERGQKITGNLLKIENGFVYIKNDLFPNLKIKKEYCRALTNKNFEDNKNKTLQTVTHFGKNKVFGDIELLKGNKLKINNINLIDDLTFDIESVANIQFNNKTKIDDADWILDLVNRDSIPCTIKSMNSKEILVSSNSGDFKVKTSDVSRLFKRMIKPNTNSRNSSFSYSNSLMDVKLPDKSEINFTIESNQADNSNFNNFGSMFQVRLFGEKKSTRNSYYLQLATVPRVYFKRNIEPKEHNKINFKNINDISIKIDKEKALFEIWVNGIHTYSFTDPDGFQAKGDGFVLYNNNRFKVSKFRFSEWDGDKLDTDKFVITDDWKIHKGAVTSIENDIVKIGDKTLKLDEVKEIAFGSAKALQKKTVYTVRLINLASFKVDSFSIDADKITIQHPLMGELSLDKSKVIEIIAN